MRTPRTAQGMTLVEVAIAITVLGIAVLPLTSMYQEVALHSVDDIYQSAALTYAESLMEEIVSRPYADPDLPKGSFGTEEGSRADYDDIDDFDGLRNSPPLRVDGTLLDDLGGFTRSARIDNVTESDPDPTTPATDGSTDFKRIEVTVRWTGGRAGELTLTTLRTELQSKQDYVLLDKPQSTASASRGGSKVFLVDVYSICDDPLLLEGFDLDVSSMPTLKRLELALEKVFQADTPTPTGQTKLNMGTPAQRTIPANGTREFRFEFKNNVSAGKKDFVLTLYFADGRSGSFAFSVTW